MIRRIHRSVSAFASIPPELAPVVGAYVRNFFRWLDARGRLVDHNVNYFLTRSLVCVELFVPAAQRHKVGSDACGDPLSTPDWDPVGLVRKACSGPPEATEPVGGLAGKNLGLLGDRLGLSLAERSILQLAVAAECTPGLMTLFSAIAYHRPEEVVSFFSACTGLARELVRPATASTGVLFMSGLLSFDSHGPEETGLSVDPRVSVAVLDPELKSESILGRFLSAEPATSLGLDDYGSRRAELGAIVRMLQGWHRTREKGVNILFYGPTGVGKTEAARVVAKLAGLELFLAGGESEGNESPTVRQRMTSLAMGNTLLRGSGSVLLFDELEDILPQAFAGFGEREAPLSKLWLNRFVESNPVPTLWTSNSLEACDPALLRRFHFAVEFPPLSERQRRGVWQRIAGEALPGEELDGLARTYSVSPGEIASAVSAAKLAATEGLDRETLRLALEGAERVRGRSTARADRAGDEYRLHALHASRDLTQLSERLCGWKPGPKAGMTLCLYGRSGTGKSEYVHYLARRMDRPLIVRNVSDLRSKWVGDTERNIASAFEEARREGGVLLFDEADSFLADRRGAQFEWERTQVNEFLQQLEACRGFVAVTTNLYRGLDPAVLRRFMFKVEFLPLKVEQRLLLWDAHLARFLAAPPDARGQRAIESALRAMGELVAGDFGVVARRVEVLGGPVEPAGLLRELEEEVCSRKHDASRSIGFRELELPLDAAPVAQARAAVE